MIKSLSDLKNLPFTTKEDLRDNYPFGLFAEPMKNVVRPVSYTHLDVYKRQDIDALPVNEDSGLPFSSEKENVMHACGHDIHTSILLCCAQVLNNLKDKFSGCEMCIRDRYISSYKTERIR